MNQSTIAVLALGAILCASHAVAADGAAASAIKGEKQAAVDLASCAKPVWPKHALRMEQQGTVTLSFLVGADGAVRDTRIAKSSGFPLLDIAAAEGLAKCKFTPGTQAGRAVEGWSQMQYVWTLKGRAQAKPDAVAELQRRAEAGDADAQFGMAGLYVSGRGVNKNLETALEWLRRAAQQNHRAAQERLGLLLAAPGTPGRAPEEAARWMMKAAEQGSTQAQATYGVMLMSGSGAPSDPGAALEWLSKAANAGLPYAQGALGVLILKEQPRRADEAMEWLHKAAAKDDPSALLVLADFHDKGMHVQQDTAKALAWYSKAAQAGSRVAMRRLADRYARGDGVPADAQKAAQLRMAAQDR